MQFYNSIFSEIIWQCFTSSCYYMKNLKIIKNYTEAESECSSLGAHVLALETQQESDDVETMFKAPAGKILYSKFPTKSLR